MYSMPHLFSSTPETECKDNLRVIQMYICSIFVFFHGGGSREKTWRHKRIEFLTHLALWWKEVYISISYLSLLSLQHTLIVADNSNMMNAPLITGDVKAPVLFRGVGWVFLLGQFRNLVTLLRVATGFYSPPEMGLFLQIAHLKWAFFKNSPPEMGLFLNNPP